MTALWIVCLVIDDHLRSNPNVDRLRFVLKAGYLMECSMAVPDVTFSLGGYVSTIADLTSSSCHVMSVVYRSMANKKRLLFSSTVVTKAECCTQITILIVSSHLPAVS